MIAHSRHFLSILSLALAAMITCEAFQAVAPVVASRTRRVTELSAWTVMPTQAAPFSTWYNEYNPTARRTIYEDAPLDYNFVALGEDWPTLELDVPTVSSEQLDQGSRGNTSRGPIRRLSKWGAGLVRRRS